MTGAMFYRALVLSILSIGFAEAGTAPGERICERLLVSGGLRAAMYRININGEEPPEMGDVVVIRDERPRPEKGEENGRPEDWSRRPEMELPELELPLQEITPTPAEREQEVPLPVIIPDLPDSIPWITPAKKRDKPLLN